LFQGDERKKGGGNSHSENAPLSGFKTSKKGTKSLRHNAGLTKEWVIEHGLKQGEGDGYFWGGRFFVLFSLAKGILGRAKKAQFLERYNEGGKKLRIVKRKRKVQQEEGKGIPNFYTISPKQTEKRDGIEPDR